MVHCLEMSISSPGFLGNKQEMPTSNTTLKTQADKPVQCPQKVTCRLHSCCMLAPFDLVISLEHTIMSETGFGSNGFICLWLG